MESGKRKRAADGVGDGRATASRRGEDDRAVTDDEVDEFFAILRRMRDLSHCFPGAADGVGSGPPRAAADGSIRVAVRWNPAFAWEDFKPPVSGEDDRGKGHSKEEAAAVVERVAENATTRDLDLNADPEPEGLAVASPRGESTAPRCARAPA